MPTGPVQQLLVAFELSLLLMGAFFVFRLATNAAQRERWLESNRLPKWPVTGAEFALLLLLLLGIGFMLQAAAQMLLRDYITASDSRAGLEVFVYGAAFHGGVLLGWLLFPSLRRRWHFDYGAPPPAEEEASKPAWPVPLYQAVGSLLVALPVLIFFNLGWTVLLRELGLPEEPQDLIAIFANTKSSLVLAGMLLVACGLAPLSEELMFRAGLYRFCRQRLGRATALLINGVCFGALHGNWAGFLPLALLGVALALAYEATGDIRVPVIAHALFNLNTVVIVLSGIPL